MEPINFNPTNKEELTYYDSLEPAMRITDPENAAEYLNDLVQYTQKFLDAEPRKDNVTAREICLQNIGYFAGYYGVEIQSRMEKLFRAVHPIFGSVG